MSKSISKQIKQSNKHKSEQELIKWCYQNEDKIKFEQYNEYHFRLFSKSGEILDLWPISKKFWNHTMSKSREYKNINDIKKYLKI